MDSIQYIWDIKDDLYDAFYSLRSGEEIRSKCFSVPIIYKNNISLITFYCDIYPKGSTSKDKNYTDFYVTLVDIPKFISHINVDYIITCKAIKLKKITTKKVFYNKDSWSWKGKIKHKKFKKIKTNAFNFIVSLKVNKIYLSKHKQLSEFKFYELNNKFYEPLSFDYSWTLNDKQLKQFYKYKTGKSIKSNIFDIKLNDNISIYFYLQLYPKGDSKEYKDQVWLFLIWKFNHKKSNSQIGMSYYIHHIYYVFYDILYKRIQIN